LKRFVHKNYVYAKSDCYGRDPKWTSGNFVYIQMSVK
jgi:hypothetical protein